MRTLNSKRLVVHLALVLSGFIALCATAEHVADYGSMCSDCHGPIPGPTSGATPIDLNNFADLDALTVYINNAMPLDSPASCVDSCAEQLAKFLEFVVPNEDVPPRASFKVTSGPITGRGEAPLAFTFDGSSSEDDDGIVSYAWDFGGSNTDTGVTASHTFSTPGLYEVTLTVTDTAGLTDSRVMNIQVRAVGAKVVADPRNTTETEGEVPLHTQFTGISSYCADNTCTHVWSPGDGSDDFEGDTSVPNNFDYLTPGNYTAILTVTDMNGNSDSAEVEIKAYPSETFESYVDSCKSALEFDDDDIPATMNCAEGELFAQSGPINDYVGHRTITDKVDLVFACRWLSNEEGQPEPPFAKAASIEMILHNRENGNTCFFKAHEEDEFSPSILVSPTIAANAAPGTPESKYWVPPIDLKRELPCVDCHVAGPYIASPRIAPFLSKFGLLNDGHDTFGLVRDEDNPDIINGDYHIVGETFQSFKDMAADFNVPSELTCANGCHSIGYLSTQGDIDEGTTTFNLLPGILSVIYHAADTVIADASIYDQGVMPANNPETGSADESDYTWINRDTPLSGPNDSDRELFSEARLQFETLLEYCEVPGQIVAHVVDSDLNVHPSTITDNLRVFNGKEGLVCVNSDQADGLCDDYSIEYYCKKSDGEEYWTGLNYRDTPWGDWDGAGDHETRSVHTEVCNSDEITTGIRATYTSQDGIFHSVIGPADRLAKFDRNGLICNNTDQVDGQCSNYVVKFYDCTAAPEIYEAKIVSAWSGRILTAAGSGNNADVRVQPNTPAWDTQDWVVEPVVGTDYVRLRNTVTGLYLNVQNESNYADVVLYDYVDDWGSQQWIIEAVSGSGPAVLIKNVWSGYYLTASNNGDYSDLKAQPNNNWPSQRWMIQP